MENCHRNLHILSFIVLPVTRFHPSLQKQEVILYSIRDLCTKAEISLASYEFISVREINVHAALTLLALQIKSLEITFGSFCLLALGLRHLRLKWTLDHNRKPESRESDWSNKITMSRVKLI